MKMYKGFNRKLQCDPTGKNQFQYEIGKTYETGDAELCKCGFHACENPLDVLSYYSPGDSRYCEVELEATEERELDSKRCGKKIHIGVEIGIKDLISAGIKLIFESCKPTTENETHAATNGNEAHAATNGNEAHAATNGYMSHAVTTGDRAHAATNGYRSHAVTNGNGAHASTNGYRSHAVTNGNGAHATTNYDRSHAVTNGNGAHAATNGYRSHASSNGYGAHAATNGEKSHASVKGKNAIACALGFESSAKGELGCWICLAEYDKDRNVVGGQFAQVDGEKIKVDTYYRIKNGKFVEVEGDN